MFYELIPLGVPSMHMGCFTFCLYLAITVIDHRTVLCGRHERLVGGIRLVSVVAHADLELDQILEFRHHGTGQENDAQPILLAILLSLKQ